MSTLKMYCLDLFNEDLNKIEDLGYIPVGLGNKQFSNSWLRDNTGENISNKNLHYGEYTFHYWFWKNKMHEIDDNTWVGFCAYRRFWGNTSSTTEIFNKNDFLTTVPKIWNESSVILGQNIYMDGWTVSKIFKHGLKSFIMNPKFFLKKNWNLKLHFDSFHGYGNLEKAIELLDKTERLDFKQYMENNICYNSGNMFICKSKNLMNRYYESIFPWLKRCEDLFGFKKQDEYGAQRIYAFLAERYLPYWFNKYAKVTIWPIIFYNLNQNNFK